MLLGVEWVHNDNETDDTQEDKIKNILITMILV